MVLGALAAGMRVISGTWLAPHAFYPAAWTVIIGVSLLVSRYPPTAAAVWWIVWSILAFSIGSWIGRGMARGRVDAHAVKAFRATGLPRIRSLIVISAATGFVFVVAFARTVEASGDSPPLIAQLLLWSIYLGPILGGLLLATERTSGTRWFVLLSVAPTLILAILGTGRTVMVFAFIFAAAGYYVARIVQNGGRVPVVRWNVIAAGLGMLVAIILLGIAISAFRGVYDPAAQTTDQASDYAQVLDKDGIQLGWDSIRPGMFGNVYAFSHFYENAKIDPPELGRGAYTFAGIVDFFDIKERTRYPNFEVEPGVLSNVYSEFMPPIMDFGFTGALVAFFAFGTLTGWAFGRAVAGILWPTPILVVFYPHVVIQGGIFFAYNSLTMTYAMLALYLGFCQIHLRVRGHMKPKPRGAVRRGIFRV